MRICLLTDESLDARPPGADPPCDPRPHLPEAEWHVAVLTRATAVRRVRELAAEGFDVFFNLCDGAWEEDRPGVEVVLALEALDVPFTGATSSFFEPARETMKRVCRAWGVATPTGIAVHSDADLGRVLDTLPFPLIVKHPNSYSSIGLTRDSRVEDAAALRREVRRMVDGWGAALVEPFIVGREVTVLVAEDPEAPTSPTTYTPMEYRFPPGESFKHYALKWVDYHGLSAAPVADAELAARARADAAALFRGLDGAGYGRCDLRVDADGRTWMLEINPNCGVFYPAADPGSADLCLLHDDAGHEGFARQVVAAALARHRRRRRPWEVRAKACGDQGLHARRAIAPGERIIAFEERAHTLVSRSHVERSWGEPEASWFPRYAWPLTDEVWVIWSRDPAEWKPINHACEPNAWLRGLDVVARLPIQPGDEITLDYATFCNEVMPAFECACESPSCRGTIRGDDHLQPFVARYGEHVSDYVRARRARG